MKKLFTLLIMAILATATSFADISLGTEDLTLSSFSSFSGSGYQTNSNYKINDYSGFSVTDGMLSSSKLQLKASSGKLVSPTIKSSAGFDIEVTYTSATNMNLTVGGQSKSSGSVLTFSTTSTSTTFTLSVGSKYAIVDKIVLKPKKQSGKTLTSLAVSGTPTKTTYNEGDTFNPAGLTVTGTYSDGNTAPITSGITWTFNPATLSVGQTSVNVTAKVGDVTSPSYTVNGLTVNGMTALTTMDEIFAAATSASATATDTKVTFNNWVVTGVKNSNAYVTDGTKGFIIYQANHGFEVGDVLSGTAYCKVQLYNGSSELTNLTSTTTGLTVTKGGTVTPQTIDIASLSGVNTGAVLKFSNVTYNGTAFNDGTNTITPYNTFMTLPTLTSGVKYNVTGVYIQFKETKEIAPRTSEDIEEVQAVKYNVTIADGIAHGTVSADPTEAPEGATVTLTATPAAGYQFGTWDVKDASNNPITVTDNKFTMPAANVTVSATFVEIPKFTVTVASGIANGTVSADVAEAPEGAEVTLTATPAEGYKFGAWDVKDASNNTITVSNDNKFTMPAANVTVSATFVEKQGGETVFYESFDTNNGTGGNDDRWTGSIATNAISTDNTGWSFTNAYGAKECAKFGTSSKKGVATTPYIKVELSKTYTLTFKAAAWNGDSETLNLSASNATVSESSVTLKTAEWTEYEVTVTPTSSPIQITFEANIASSNRFFLDEVKLVEASAPTPKTLESIAISGTPSTTTYTVGDAFNKTGLTVTANYDDKSTKDVTASVTWEITPSTFSAAGENVEVTVKATYEGKEDSKTYSVTVKEPVTLSSITISGTPTKTAYKVGETFSAAGLKVNAVYSDESSKEVTATWTFEPATFSAAGSVTATATYTEGDATKTASITFDVTEVQKYTYTWYVNGVVYGDVQTLYKGEAVTKPADPATPEALTGKVFTGWVTSSTVDPESEPTYVTVDETAKANRSYYAVFATKTGTGSAGYKKVDLTKLPENPGNDAQKRAAYVSYWTSGEYLFVREQDNKYLVFNGSKSESTSQNWIEAGSITTDYIISDENATNAAKIAFEKVEGENNYFWIKQKYVDDTYFAIDGNDGKGLKPVQKDELNSTYDKASIEITDNECLVHIYQGNSTLYFRPGYGFRFHKPDDNVTKNPIWVYEKTQGATYSDWTTGEVPVLRPLASIALSGEYPTVFEVGDRFSHEGMVVTATYDDATTKVVTSKAKFEVNMAQVGEQTVTVSYTEGEVTKTATYTITIKKKSARAYTLVTSQDDIVDGGEYIILSEDGNYAAAVGTNKRIQTEARGENTYKIVDNTVIVSSYSITRPYFLVATDGGWYLNDGEFNASLNNKTHVEFVGDTQDVFTVSIAADNTAKITAPAVAADRQIEYHYWTNDDVVSRAFRYYLSTNTEKEDYQAIKLYKRVNTVVIEDGYRSKYNESTERNLYKNTLTYDVPKANDVLKLYRGTTLLGTFTVDATNENYTFAPESVFDADKTNRFDGEAVVLSGNADDGLTITDYYSEFIDVNMPEAVRYSLRDADDVEVGVAVVPLYRSTASGRVMMDPANNIEGYTAADIANDAAHEKNYQKTVRVDVAHADIDGLSGIKVYRNHEVVGNAGATDEYVDVTVEKLDQSSVFESELVVASQYGENTYGSPKATVHAALVTLTVHDKGGSKYAFTTADGKTGHYFSALIDATLDTPENEFELVGIRAWRTCNSSAEPIQEFEGRSSDYNFATILDTNNFAAIEGNEVKNIGNELITYQDAAGTLFQFTSGVFGSFEKMPTVSWRVRAYYRRIPQSSSAPMMKAPAAEMYYVAEDFVEVKFTAADIETGILDVFGAKEVKSVRYFNIMGVESAEPVDGVNIVVTTYTDGTSSSAKMLR